MYNNSGEPTSRAFTLRPVVTLKSNVQVDISDITKDGKSAVNSYVIKNR